MSTPEPLVQRPRPTALPAPAVLPEGLQRELEDLGLAAYEARVLLALLQLGSATTFQLASLSGVPRSSSYHVLESLADKRVAMRLPGEGPALWACAGRDEVLERLVAAHEEQLRQQRQRAERVRDMLERSMPETPAVALPYVHHLKGAASLRQTYEDLLYRARTEVVMFTRPPYTWQVGTPNPVVLDTLARGISVRVLYEAAEWDSPAAAGLRAEVASYHQAGVQARLAEHLPIKVFVADRQVALVNMAETEPGSYPTTLLVEHEGFAAYAAAGFETYWAAARALEDSPE